MLGIWLFSIICLGVCNVRIISADSSCVFVTESTRESMFLKKLKPLMGKRLQATGKFSNSSENYKVNFGFCIDAIDGDKYKNVGMIQKELKTEKTHIIGLYNRTQIMGGDDWMFLIYKDGDKYQHHCVIENSTDHKNREAHIMITCDPDVELSQLSLVEENNDVAEECYYLFQVSTKYVCAPTEDSLGAGSIFCIIFFTTAGVYLIIGFLYQRIVVGAKGLEQVPNYSFWKEFGKLQADGCDFLCRCGERQEMKMYRGIDDQLLNSERREEPDDRLLPM